MAYKSIKDALQFYFVTDDNVPLSFTDQTKIAIKAGATTVQYRNKNFRLQNYEEVMFICSLCFQNGVMFIVNDDILLAKAVSADGVHLGQDDEKIGLARKILGLDFVLGLSISTLDELDRENSLGCDYIGIGPVFDTKTKLNAKPSLGLDGLDEIVRCSSVPTVAIGGIDSTNARACMDCGVDGISVISCITRSENPDKVAGNLARICFNSI